MLCFLKQLHIINACLCLAFCANSIPKGSLHGPICRASSSFHTAAVATRTLIQSTDLPLVHIQVMFRLFLVQTRRMYFQIWASVLLGWICRREMAGSKRSAYHFFLDIPPCPSHHTYRRSCFLPAWLTLRGVKWLHFP